MSHKLQLSAHSMLNECKGYIGTDKHGRQNSDRIDNEQLKYVIFSCFCLTKLESLWISTKFGSTVLQ